MALSGEVGFVPLWLCHGLGSQTGGVKLGTLCPQSRLPSPPTSALAVGNCGIQVGLLYARETQCRRPTGNDISLARIPVPFVEIPESQPSVFLGPTLHRYTASSILSLPCCTLRQRKANSSPGRAQTMSIRAIKRSRHREPRATFELPQS